jgi:hypothetical protein
MNDALPMVMVSWSKLGPGAATTAISAIVVYVMVRLARSQTVHDFMYRDNTRARRVFGIRAADKSQFTEGIVVGFFFAGLLGIAGIVVGISLVIRGL